MNLHSGNTWVQPRPGLEPNTAPATSQCSSYLNSNRLPQHGKNLEAWFLLNHQTFRIGEADLNDNLCCNGYQEANNVIKIKSVMVYISVKTGLSFPLSV
jgi:hypothetical protein